MNNNDYRLFKYAENISDMSDFPRIKVGCVVAYRGKVISVGFNSQKTHPLQKIYNAYRFDLDTPAKLHAEIHSLLPLLKKDIDWNHVAIYICRINRASNTKGLARPCPSCMAMIKSLGIKHVYYTTADGYAYERIEY